VSKVYDKPACSSWWKYGGVGRNTGTPDKAFGDAAVLLPALSFAQKSLQRHPTFLL